jgi:hypothetical protein
MVGRDECWSDRESTRYRIAAGIHLCAGTSRQGGTSNPGVPCLGRREVRPPLTPDHRVEAWFQVDEHLYGGRAKEVELYTILIPLLFQRPPYERAPSPAEDISAYRPRQILQVRVSCKRRTRFGRGCLLPLWRHDRYPACPTGVHRPRLGLVCAATPLLSRPCRSFRQPWHEPGPGAQYDRIRRPCDARAGLSGGSEFAVVCRA